MLPRLIFLFGLICAMFSNGAIGVPIVFSASGADPASIAGVVDAFRASLGTLNPNTPGSAGSGRREINWDGVPDIFAAPNNLPANFFNVNSPRGVLFSTPGAGFQVSATAASGTPIKFGNIDPSYPAIFDVFSPQRLFTALGSNIVDISFFIPGTNTPALTNGFGAVFTDVDMAALTNIQFFDINNTLLTSAFAQPGTTANESLSFLGARFTEGNIVSHVRISAGNAPLGAPETGATDLVVMDDFIFGEPTLGAAQVPEPSTLALLSLGMLAMGLFRRDCAATCGTRMKSTS